MREYIVTLKSKEDLESFYEDMETDGGSITIPGRRVECSSRRNISRNTHYMLADEEAEQIRNDDRVLAVELIPSLRDIYPTPLWEQTGNFEKASIIDSDDKNWGLYRVINGQPLQNWGTNSLFTQTTQSILTTSSGKHVDVVVVDSHINFDHPEFAVNPDGTGGSRAIQYDWFQHSSRIGLFTPGSYDYSNISSNHGTHVAGTVAGNTQGWARDANIYNMEFNYSVEGVSNWALYIFDYLREWHKTKPINPVTKRRNPTVTNHSWGYSYLNLPIARVSRVNYRGMITDLSSYSDSLKGSLLLSRGLPVVYSSTIYKMPARVASLDADIQDAIDDGVIVISSAGNSYWNSVTFTSQDWFNYIQLEDPTFYFHQRGASPGAADGVICVGSVGTNVNEYKSEFSNYGERVDIWAPGSNIISSVYDSTAASEFFITLADDPRDSNYKLGSISGTSMSSPQVTGVVACYAEQNPNITPAEALEYLIDTCTLDQIGDTGGNYGDYTSLGDSTNNRYLFYKKERPTEGVSQPKVNFKKRPSSGMTFPRRRLR